MCSEFETGYRSLSRLGFAKKWIGTIITARKINERTLSIGVPRSFIGLLKSSITKPIFIIGSGRSGTTLLGKVINALPDVSYYREPAIGKYYVKPVYEGSVTFEEARKFYTNLYGALMKVAPRGGDRFAEKNPSNIFISDTLLRIFPDAKFVHIYRDGRDVTCSLLRKPWLLRKSLNLNKREHSGYLSGPYPPYYIEKERRGEYYHTKDVHRCIWAWKRFVESGLHLKKIMPPTTLCHIQYEELVEKPNELILNLLQFLDVYSSKAYEKAMKVAGQIYKGSVGRWNEELSPEDLQVVYSEGGEMLRAYGYM